MRLSVQARDNEGAKALSIEDMLPPLPITADLRDVDAYTPTVANRIILALAAAGVERGTGRQQPGA
jgi:hypothetical protein